MALASELGSPPLSPSEAARELGVSAATVRRWVSLGELPAVRLGDGALEDFVRPAHAEETA